MESTQLLDATTKVMTGDTIYSHRQQTGETGPAPLCNYLFTKGPTISSSTGINQPLQVKVETAINAHLSTPENPKIASKIASLVKKYQRGKITLEEYNRLVLEAYMFN